MHVARAQAHVARADGSDDDAQRHDRDADAHEERALAAEERADAARHRETVEAIAHEAGAAERSAGEQRDATKRSQRALARDERIRRRLADQQVRQQEGARRFRPGPGSTLYSPGMMGTASRWAPTAEQDLDREIDEIARALDERGPTGRDELAELVGARFWGPGRFRAALREAVADRRARRLSRDTYAPPERMADGSPD
jgi:hypothetical protein